MQPRSRVWELNGLRHHALEWGPDAGSASATALVVHGFQDAAATWEDVAAALAQSGLRVLAPDMRGFGDGARVPPGGYYYFPDYVADVAALARADAAARDGASTPLFLIGHSMGATVASYFAGAFPERVQKLALVDGVGPPNNDASLAPTRMRRWIETAYESPLGDKKPMTRADALARLSRNNPDIDVAVLARKLAQLSRVVEAGGAAGDAADVVVWKHDPLHATTSPLPFYGDAYKAFARRVACPVLYVSGGDKGFHVDDEDERLACFAHLSRTTIEGGHSLHWSKPRELTEALVAFWST